MPNRSRSFWTAPSLWLGQPSWLGSAAWTKPATGDCDSRYFQGCQVFWNEIFFSANFSTSALPSYSNRLLLFETVPLKIVLQEGRYHLPTTPYFIYSRRVSAPPPPIFNLAFLTKTKRKHLLTVRLRGQGYEICTCLVS